MDPTAASADGLNKLERIVKIAFLPTLLALVLVIVLTTGGDDSENELATDDMSEEAIALGGEEPQTEAEAVAEATAEAAADGSTVETGDEIPEAVPFSAEEERSIVEDLIAESELEATGSSSDPSATTTTTTAAAAGATGSGTTSAPAVPASVAEPLRITSPACGSLNASSTRTAPFTGLSASIPSNMPAVVVKVSNNSSASRAALIGLDQADIVFEERIEASATRFFSVFHSSLPENVGPVRSGRTTDIELAQNLNNPIFGYSGSNQGVARQLNFAAQNGLMTLYPNTDRSPFARDPRFSSPDNLFVSPAGLGACGSSNPTPIFSYGAANSGTAQAASSVSFSARSSYRFDWNGSAWVRSQSGYQHTTRDGAALAPENVVVLFVPYIASEVDSQSVDATSVGSGVAWTLRDGTVTVGRYVRERAGQPYTLLDGNGSVINLAAGQTWVVLAPEGTASVG